MPERGGLRGLFNSDMGAEAGANNAAARLDCQNNERMKAYYKDELTVSKGNVKYTNCSLSTYIQRQLKNSGGNFIFHFRHYLYQGDAMLYGFYEGGAWNFGVKDQGLESHGKEIVCNAGMTCDVRVAEYPL